RKRRRHRPLAALLVVAAFGAAAFAALQHFHSKPQAAVAAPPAHRQHRTVTATRPLLTAPANLPSGGLRVAARSAILADATTGSVLWEKAAHEPLPIASTTKIMTAVVVLERLSLDQVVKVGPAAPRTPLVREGLRAG